MAVPPILLILGVALAQAQQTPNNDVILSSQSENNYNGTYKYRYETSNGITVEEEGSLKNPGTEGEAQSARGSYSYTAPDGQVITVNWYADETGFHVRRIGIKGQGARPTDNPRPSDIPRPTDMPRPTNLAQASPEFFRG